MTETLPEDIQQDLEKAITLHQRTTSDYKKCLEFNQLMSNILGRLEDAGFNRTADRVMTILLDCNPREGAHCEKSTVVANRIEKFRQT